MELPLLKSLHKNLKEKGFELIAVESTQNKTGAQKFIEENGLPYLFVEDVSGADSISRSVYTVFAYPTTFIIDRQGRIRSYHLGFDAGDEKSIEKEIIELLNEGG